MAGPSGVARKKIKVSKPFSFLDDIDEEILKQLPDDIRKEIEAERKKRNIKPKEKSLRERRGNSIVPSYLDFYSTSSSSEDDAATGTH